MIRINNVALKLVVSIIAITLLPKIVFADDLWDASISASQATGQFVHEVYDIDLDENMLSSLSQGDTATVSLPDKVLTILITLKSIDDNGTVLVGVINGHADSLFYLLVSDDAKLSGLFYEKNSDIGFRFEYSDSNRLYKMNIDQIACLDYGFNSSDSMAFNVDSTKYSARNSSSPYALTVTSHESLPGSDYVLYIDFDGEVVSDEHYSNTHNDGNPIIAEPFDLDGNSSDFNAVELNYIDTVWKAVSEDYVVFDINVTTDRSVYDAASVHKRARAIVTPSCAWYVCSETTYGLGPIPQFGAYSFDPSYDSYSPAWIFAFKYNGDLRRSAEGVAQDVSHEFGHGFWLAHDGATSGNPSLPDDQYYPGNNEWSPIMGFVKPASDKFVTFSKGEYLNANEDQDDIAQINYHLSFRFDSNETKKGEGLREGIIGSYDEDDYTFFAKPTDTLNLMVSPRVIGVTNLDARLQLYDPDGVLVVDANPTNSYNASITHVPTKQGTYKVRVSGVGSTTANSYTRYGSIGQYTLNIARSQINPDPVPIVMAPIHYLLLDDD